MNALSFVALAHLGAKPLEPFGKGSNALKAGTPDAGPEGPAVSGALTPVRPSVQPPAGVERNTALYARPARNGKAIETRLLRASGGGWRAGKGKAIEKSLLGVGERLVPPPGSARGA